MSWILVANRTGASVIEKQGMNFSLLETFQHERGRTRDREIESDRHGRSFNRVGGGRHALTTSETPHEHDAKTFARELAAALRARLLERRFERLVLVAEPHFLGLLRHALDDVTARSVIATVPKDLTGVAPADLAAHLPPLPQPVV